jgi:hypothetical protein
MKRKMIRILVGSFAGVGLLLFGFRAEGQANRWINQISGKWEVGPNWSLDLPPSSQQFIFVTNSGSDLIISNTFLAKRITIDAITAAQNSNTMTVTSLSLAGAGSAAGGNVVNWLSLTNTSSAVPLHVLTGVTMAQGSLLSVDSSPLNSSFLLVDGKLDVGAQVPTQFTANFPATFWLNSGFAQIGNLTLGSGSNLVGTLNLSSGTLVAGNLGIGNNGTVNLGSGTGIATVTSGANLAVSSLSLGSLAGGRGSLQINSNATVNVLSNITLVSSSLATTSSVSISGGSFSATNGPILVGPNGAGSFSISGGKHFIQQLKLGGPGTNSSGHFVISGGTLKLLGNSSAAGNSLVVNSADFEGGDVDGSGTSVTIGDNGHSANATMRGGSAVFNAMYVGHQPGYTGTYTQSAGTMTILSNLIVGDDCPDGSSGAVGIATLLGGWLFVTNSTHTAVLDVRNGSFTLQSGAVLVVDNLVVTNACGHFTNNGGIIIPGNSFYTGNLLLDPGGEDTLNPDLDPNDHLYPWTVNSASPPGVTDSYPRTGGWVFYGGTGAGLYGSMTQTVNLVDNQGITLAALDSGKLLADVIFWEQTVPDGLNLGPKYDYAQVSLSFLDADSNTISTVLTSPLEAHIGYWSNYTGQHVIPPTTRSLQYAIDFHSLHSSGMGDRIFEDDNLLFVTGTPSPPLSVDKVGDNIVLSWPAWAANFDLQSSATLARPIPWETVTNVPVAAWGRYFVTNSMSGAQYYRLRGKY